jgi:hypothetical protein
MKPQHEGGRGTWSVPEYVMVRSIMVVEHGRHCGIRVRQILSLGGCFALNSRKPSRTQ